MSRYCTCILQSLWQAVRDLLCALPLSLTTSFLGTAVVAGHSRRDKKAGDIRDVGCGRANSSRREKMVGVWPAVWPHVGTQGPGAQGPRSHSSFLLSATMEHRTRFSWSMLNSFEILGTNTIVLSRINYSVSSSEGSKPTRQTYGRGLVHLLLFPSAVKPQITNATAPLVPGTFRATQLSGISAKMGPPRKALVVAGR